MSSKGMGIVGCGMIASWHAKAIASLDGAHVAGHCSRSLERAQSASAPYDAFATDALDALLARKDVDIISICTPSGAHMEAAVAAARAGKHVIVEKPLDVTLERCDAIINACRDAGVCLSVIYPTRFLDAARVVKDAIERGRIGRPVLGDAYVKWWRGQAYYDDGGWKGTRALDGGGALMNQSIHAIDLLQWLMGPVKRISGAVGTLAHERIEVEDTGVATLEFASGALGVIEGSTGAYPGFDKRFEISGDRGTIVLQEADIITWDFAETDPDDERIRREFGSMTTEGGANDHSAIDPEFHRRQFEDVLRAIDTGSAPFITGEDARKSVEIVLAIYRAAETGSSVTLPLSP